MALSIAVGNFLAGRLAKRFSARVLVATGVLVSMVGGFLMTLLSGDLTIIRVVVPVMIFVLGFGLVSPSATSMALHPFPHVAGSASAMFGFVRVGFAGLLSIATGPLYDGTATPLGWIMLGCAGVGLLIYVSLVKNVNTT